MICRRCHLLHFPFYTFYTAKNDTLRARVVCSRIPHMRLFRTPHSARFAARPAASGDMRFPWDFPCSCLCVYYTIFGNFWVTVLRTELREEVELEGPGEAKTWLGESFILAMKRNHRHRHCHRNQRDARLGFCTQRTSVQFVCQPSHVK